jgi:hypothetical protein
MNYGSVGMDRTVLRCSPYSTFIRLPIHNSRGASLDLFKEGASTIQQHKMTCRRGQEEPR